MNFVHKAVVMDAGRLDRALARLASEIAERNGGAENVVLVGVRRRGVPLAERLAQRMASLEGAAPRVASIDVAFYNDDLSLVASSPVVRSTSLSGDVAGATLVLVDDVLYTGRTVWAAIQHLLVAYPAHRIQLAVLIDRGHHALPIHPDYVGRFVATKANEIIKVMLREFDDAEQAVIVELEAGAAS